MGGCIIVGHSFCRLSYPFSLQVAMEVAQTTVVDMVVRHDSECEVVGT